MVFISMLIAIVGIVFCSAYLKWHPFLTLLAAAILLGLVNGLSPFKITEIINEGFGNMMKKIGLIIILGTLFGSVLEKTGAIEKIANSIIHFFGAKQSLWAITIIGVIVGIPIFCDSGFIILRGLVKPLALKTKKNYIAIVTGLAVGLYITHTLLPPHPGSVAGVSNLGLKNNFGMVILIGLVIAVCTTIAFCVILPKLKLPEVYINEEENTNRNITSTTLPSFGLSIGLLALPLALIAIATVCSLFQLQAVVQNSIQFIGNPVMSLLIGFVCSLSLFNKHNKSLLSSCIKDSIHLAGPILIIVGAGGVFGEVLKKLDLQQALVQWLPNQSISIFVTLILAWFLGLVIKTAQGSTTSAIIVVTAILAPITAQLGIVNSTQLCLLLMAICSGTMMVSHTNDAYFWVISEFSNMSMHQTFKSFSIASIIVSVLSLIVILLMALVLV